MICFGKQVSFLLILSQCHERHRSDTISEVIILDQLSVSYKTLHKYATNWEQKGCVRSHVRRGGISEYQLTMQGQGMVKQLKKARKLWSIVAGGILFVCMLSLLFFV